VCSCCKNTCPEMINMANVQALSPVLLHPGILCRILPTVYGPGWRTPDPPNHGTWPSIPDGLLLHRLWWRSFPWGRGAACLTKSARGVARTAGAGASGWACKLGLREDSRCGSAPMHCWCGQLWHRLRSSCPWEHGEACRTAAKEALQEQQAPGKVASSLVGMYVPARVVCWR
jgi:hypothetical protein